MSTFSALSSATTTTTTPAPLTLGSWKVWALHDGWMEVPVDRFIAPRTASRHEVAEALDAWGLDTATLRVPVLALLLQRGDATILIDAGCGHGRAGYPMAGHLVRSLQQAGFSPEAITQVILTHAHLDHIGGLVDAEGQALFPQAVHQIHAAEWAHWQHLLSSRHPADPVQQRAMVEIHAAIAPLVQTVTERQELAHGLRLAPLPGHTPGHCAVELHVRGRLALTHISDLALHDQIYFDRPEWDFLLDLEPESASTTRHRILRQLAKDQTLVFGTHFRDYGFGTVQAEGDSYSWLPREM